MMAELKTGELNVTDLLREKYKKFGKGWITLMEFPPEIFMDVCSESLRILINEMEYSCIYITLSKPFNELDNIFKSKDVDTNKLFYIDAISQMYGEKQTSTKKCIYASGPLDIDSITVALHQ